MGTALTIQTSLGFLLSVATIWLTVPLAERWGWGVTFSALALGLVFGIWQILRLKAGRGMGGNGDGGDGGGGGGRDGIRTGGAGGRIGVDSDRQQP